MNTKLITKSIKLEYSFIKETRRLRIIIEFGVKTLESRNAYICKLRLILFGRGLQMNINFLKKKFDTL